MSSSNLEAIQNLLLNFQKTMQAKSSTVRGQWNAVTLLEKISQVQFARRMNAFGISASNDDVAQLFYYLGIKKNSLDYNTFISLMETDPSTLGTRSGRISNTKDIEHVTLRSFENDLNKYVRRTTVLTPTSQTRGTLASDQIVKNSKKITRPFTTSNAQRSKNSNYGSQYKKSKQNVVRANRSRANDNDDYNNAHDNGQYDDNNYYQDHYHEDGHLHTSRPLGDSGSFSYDTCKACLERSLPREKSGKKNRDATLLSFSNTSIQRQDYDGIDVSKTLNRDTGIPIDKLINTISDIAYTAHPNSMSCFLKWRDQHHDLLDANDLRNGLKYDNNFVISRADAQKVIDKYGGPMNHSTFAVMLHDGSPFNRERTFDDDSII